MSASGGLSIDMEVHNTLDTERVQGSGGALSLEQVTTLTIKACSFSSSSSVCLC